MRGRGPIILMVVLALLSVQAPASVVWLELGSPVVPARGPDAAVLSPASLANLHVKVYDRQDIVLGTADLTGLDEAEPGHFLGVIDVGDNATGQGRLRLASGAAGLTADLGAAPVLTDDFQPDVDPDRHGVVAVTLTWAQAPDHQLRVSATGFGGVPGGVGIHTHGAVVELVPTAHPWWEFEAWHGDVPPGHEQDDPLDITLDVDRALTASFRLIVPDSWLLANFGTTIVDLDDDPEKDGYSTREEYENGTDPLARTLADAHLAVGAGWNQVVLPVQPDRHVTVEEVFGPNLRGPALRWDPWLGTFIRVTRVQAKEAVWAYLAAPVSDLVVPGQAVGDGSFRAYSGWNAGGQAAAAALTQEPGLVFPAWRWDSIRQLYRSRNPGDVPQVGEGLSFFMQADGLVWDGD